MKAVVLVEGLRLGLCSGGLGSWVRGRGFLGLVGLLTAQSAGVWTPSTEIQAPHRPPKRWEGY